MHSTLRVSARFAPIALFTLAAAGCGSSNETLGQDQSETSLWPNDKIVCDYFIGKGLSPAQAAGIVGNLDQESSGATPTSIEPGGPGRGIAQWSVGGRWDTYSDDNMMWYASQHGEALWSLQPQLDFIWYELTTYDYYGLASLRGSSTVSSATIAFMSDFEDCGQCDPQTRIDYAQAALTVCGTGGGGGGGGGKDCTLAGHSYASNTCTETQQCNDGNWEARTADPSNCNTGVEANGGCLTDSGSVAPQNTCTSTLQCDDGVWVARTSDPSACLGGSTGGGGGGSTSCSLSGHSYAQNTCTETEQCDDGNWVARTSDPSTCNAGFEPSGECLTDSGSIAVQNTCTSTLQCDDGVWVDRESDPAACNCELAGHSYATNTCTETEQCNDGNWEARTADPSNCKTGIEASGGCLTDGGSVVPENTCTSTLQCDDGVWVARTSDPASCL